jgi:hypothetical protein
MSSLYLQILNLNIVLFQLALVLRSVSAAALLSTEKIGNVFVHSLSILRILLTGRKMNELREKIWKQTKLYSIIHSTIHK